MRRRDPNAIAYCHQSPWHVPIRWFVLIREEERWLGEDEFGRLRLRYRTTTRRAMRRAEHAAGAAAPVGPRAHQRPDRRTSHQWLATFDPASLVELDYAELCDFMTWDELDDDHSAREIHEALEALEQEAFAASAADVYQGVLARWAEVRSREILN